MRAAVSEIVNPEVRVEAPGFGWFTGTASTGITDHHSANGRIARMMFDQLVEGRDAVLLKRESDGSLFPWPY